MAGEKRGGGGRRIGVVAAIALLVLVGVVALRTGPGRRPGEAAPATTGTAPGPDLEAALPRFAEALRIRTLSHAPDSGLPRDDAAFRRFHDLLRRSYPEVHRRLRRETVSGLSLLYTWPGSDPALEPVVLLGHIDVVPADPTTLEEWTHPPFAGVVADGYLWGRGAIDDKINVMGLMEAAEWLLRRDFRPERTLLLSFGHDEELGGREGAAVVAGRLREQGARPALVVDEGGAVVEGVLPGLSVPLAAVGVAEKGYVSLTLTVETRGGHSSAPPRHTAIGRLASAIHRLERQPLPSRFEGMLARTLSAVAPHMELPHRIALRNLWLTRPLVERALLSMPEAAPTLRTTTAATIFQAGVKDNVLPSKATAVVNFRIFPGDTIESVIGHVRRAIDDDAVRIQASAKRREASSRSPTEGPAWELLGETIRETYPEAAVAPFLIPGGTDARHFRGIAEAVYGFMPVRTDDDDMRRAHGLDERIAVASYGEALRFYVRLLERVGAWRGVP